jgi:recombination protein RecT
MATTETVKKEVAKVGTRDLRSLIEQSAKELARALPEHMRPERLVRIALTCIRTNPALGECTPESFLGALFVAAQIGVEPVAGQAYILPFNNKRAINGEWKTVKEAQFVLGYKGLASLFYRHEKAVQISWGVVHEHDEFEYEYGTEARLSHKPRSRDRGAVEGYYVVASLAGGGKPFMYMSREECLAHGKKHSKTFDKKSMTFYASSPWATNEDAMCLKTCLIQLGKLLPLSVEIQTAISADETSRDFKTGIGDAMDMTPTTTWDADGETVKDNPIGQKEVGEIPFTEAK